MTKRSTYDVPRAIDWVGGLDGHAALIDQTLLPGKLEIIECHAPETVWHAIKRLSVRGAPAIGIAAAMGVVLGVRDHDEDDVAGFVTRIRGVCDYLAGARPTAINLFWALDRMRKVGESADELGVSATKQALLAEARRIREEDAAMCRAIGEAGLPLIQDGVAVLTHCNAGGLATAELGTALAPLYLAREAGRKFSVYADETRPLLQGARLTAWELGRAGVDVTLICDNAAGACMAAGRINLVITGADCVAANGDVANKIGTYSVAVLAAAHRIPFYVAAPSSTFALDKPTGAAIPIEERAAAEVRSGFGAMTAPKDVRCFNPAFDVTPARLLTGIITERGIISPVREEGIRELLSASATCPDSCAPS
jgi:methylthioribose-1-phosphate isomerase